MPIPGIGSFLPGLKSLGVGPQQTSSGARGGLSGGNINTNFTVGSGSAGAPNMLWLVAGVAVAWYLLKKRSR